MDESLLHTLVLRACLGTARERLQPVGILVERDVPGESRCHGHGEEGDCPEATPGTLPDRQGREDQEAERDGCGGDAEHRAGQRGNGESGDRGPAQRFPHDPHCRLLLSERPREAARGTKKRR